MASNLRMVSEAVLVHHDAVLVIEAEPHGNSLDLEREVALALLQDLEHLEARGVTSGPMPSGPDSPRSLCVRMNSS